MKHVPGYLMPRIANIAGSAAAAASAAGGPIVPEGASQPRQGAEPLVPFYKPGTRGRGRGRGGRGGGGGGRRSLGGPGGGAGGGKKKDPLKTFKS